MTFALVVLIHEMSYNKYRFHRSLRSLESVYLFGVNKTFPGEIEGFLLPQDVPRVQSHDIQIRVVVDRFLVLLTPRNFRGFCFFGGILRW